MTRKAHPIPARASTRARPALPQIAGAPREPAPSDHPDWRSALRFERVVFFSDAVMAIAITLLLVDLRPPDSGAGYEAALADMLSRPEPFVAVAIGFLVLGSYWMGHRAVFSLLARATRLVLWANLLFLFWVAIQPFFTMALAAHGPFTLSVVAYSVCQVFTGLALWLVWVAALRTPGALAIPVTRDLGRYMHVRLLRAPVAFMVSIPVALVAGPAAGMVTWTLQILIAIVASRFIPGTHDPDAPAT